MNEMNNFVIFMVVISQEKCHILPQSIKEREIIAIKNKDLKMQLIESESIVKFYIM